MFPSSGLFAHVNCPFVQRGLCERPNCLYKHVTESWNAFGGLFKSSSVVDLTGSGKPCGGPVKDGSTNVGLHELERINKEIETVRYEVEQEQRRLSCYQTEQADIRICAPMSNFEARGPPLSKDKTYARVRKYVVDNSKPRTDLEYDPLSNFSAALRSYRSAGEEHEVENREAKRSRREHVDQTKPSTHQAQVSQSTSPELFNDSTEDCVLVTHVPLPEKISGQAQKAITVKSFKVQIHEVDKVKMETASLNPPPKSIKNLEVNVAISPSIRDNINKVHDFFSAENNQGSITSDDCKESENVPGSAVDLSGHLKAFEREDQNASFQGTKSVDKISKLATFPIASGQQDYNGLLESTSSVEKISSLQPPNNSLLYKPLAANCPLMKHLTKQAVMVELPAQDKVQSDCSPPVPYVVQDSQKMLSKIPGKMQRKSTINQEQAEAASCSSQLSFQDVSSSVNSHCRAESESTEQLLKAESEAVIIIDSSSDEGEEEEEELNCANMELSDSDPMEECYRIFMEANGEERRNEEHPDTSAKPDMDDEPKVNIALQALPGKKRVAHEATNLKQPLAKSRPQPQVLVPLREPAASGFGYRPSITSTVQQVQQRASMLTASVKAAQAFVSSTSQNKPEAQCAPSGPCPENLQPDPVHSAYLNYIPVGTTVIEVGNNLHLILPQGSFPLSVASTSSPVTSVLTPVNQVHPSPVSFNQLNNLPTVTALSRYRPAAPVLIAAPARRPVLNSALASTLHSTAAPTISQTPVQAAVKSRPQVKRKLKQSSEAAKDKVPHDVRQRYVNMFTEEFLKTTLDVNDAFEKALAEERSVYNRSMNKLKYLSVAVNALKRLKNQNVAAKSETKVQSQKPKGNIPFNRKKLKPNEDLALYESLKDYILTGETMIENNYPVQHQEKPGSVYFSDKKVNTDPLKRICCRCGATYSVSQTGKHVRKEECNYHYGKGVEKRVPGGVETRYSCCQGTMGAPGCQVFKLHVHDSLSLDGFVSTAQRYPSDMSCPGVYSLDCEMCYTLQGLELSRVTVVNSNLQVVYDTFVRPDNEVIDYNTRFSGISEVDMKGNHTPLREVQETLLSFISVDTILVGHELETDLCLLKLLHGMVVDTSVIFPHRLGPPYKLSLNSLTAEHLRRIIQESVCGHDTAEDAAACMELMLWKMKEDGKLKK